jgi:16S rRNA (cytosine1402-N4)-methyltransferase
MSLTLWLEPVKSVENDKKSWSFHESVLADEVVAALQPAEGKLILDGTLGGGGHTRRLLEAGADIIAMDRDVDAVAHGAETLRDFAGRLRLIHGNFEEAPHALDLAGVSKVDGILLDLGVSSWQLDTPERGFSFRTDGPLDMRMNTQTGETAADIVNLWSETELARLFFELGEEPGSRRVAAAIVADRRKTPFETTTQLAGLVERVLGRRGPRHPATRVFQAIRVEVNDELGALRRALENLPMRLQPGGRFAIITFHSLEDRIVKNSFREKTVEWIDQPGWPAPLKNERRLFNRLSSKPIVPSEEELSRNPRARSAKLRVVERRFSE